MKINPTLQVIALLLTITSARAQTVDMPEVRAQTVDMADLKCSDLSRLYLEEFVVIDAWFSGYYHGKSNTTVIDANKIAMNTHKVLEVCKANPDVTIMQAIEKLSAAGG
jgi:hypothetical protein